MAEVQSSYVDANGIKVHYYSTGSTGKPVLVMAHGVTDDGMCWYPIAKQLADDYDIIMVDARGHGLSDEAQEGDHLFTLADDLAGVIQSLGLEKPYVLGHSMGAITTLIMAGRYPDLAKAILLEDPPSWWKPQDPTPHDSQRRRGMGEWFKAIKSKTKEEIIADGKQQSPDWPEEEFEPWAEAKMRFSPTISNLLNMDALNRNEVTSTVAQVKCPTLLMRADKDRGAIVAAEDVESLKAVLPQVQGEVISGAGHNIRRDQPERYLEVVRAFLAEQEAA
ncbi:MAG: alpha/beta hydrolase [Anaerolineaceae bacterium]|nr:alpha/beta hydrolase [Anaerolineaceae bacterium]